MQDSRKIEWDEIVKLGIDNSANINEEPDETTSFLFQAFAPSVLEPDKLGNESKNKLSEAKARKMGRDVDVYGKLHLELNLGDSGGEDQRERGERQIEQYVAGQLVSRARFSLAQAFEKVIESDELPNLVTVLDDTFESIDAPDNEKRKIKDSWESESENVASEMLWSVASSMREVLSVQDLLTVAEKELVMAKEQWGLDDDVDLDLYLYMQAADEMGLHTHGIAGRKTPDATDLHVQRDQLRLDFYFSGGIISEVDLYNWLISDRSDKELNDRVMRLLADDSLAYSTVLYWLTGKNEPLE